MGDNEEKTKHKNRLLLLLYPFAILIWLLGWKFGPWVFGATSDVSDIGDVFGAVNALFTALAFAGLIHTVVMQREELELQRGELTLTRREIAGQRQQLEQQTQLLFRQSYENTLFRLFELIGDTIEDIEIDAPGTIRGKITGEACFKHHESRINPTFLANAVTQGDQGRTRQDWLLPAIQDRAIEAIETFGPFYRALDVTLAHLDIAAENRKQYDELLRSHLFPSEVFFIGIRGLYDPNMRKKIEDHGLLKYIDGQYLYVFTDLDLFTPSAFN